MAKIRNCNEDRPNTSSRKSMFHLNFMDASKTKEFQLQLTSFKG
jgi:hypothetical protein